MAEDTRRFSGGTAYEQFMGRRTRAVGTIFLKWLAPPTDARWLDIRLCLSAFSLGCNVMVTEILTICIRASLRERDGFCSLEACFVSSWQPRFFLAG